MSMTTRLFEVMVGTMCPLQSESAHLDRIPVYLSGCIWMYPEVFLLLTQAKHHVREKNTIASHFVLFDSPKMGDPMTPSILPRKQKTIV